MLDEYLSELAAFGYSPATIRLRRWQLSTWISHVGGVENLAVADGSDVAHLFAVLGSLSARRGMGAAIRSFHRWAYGRGYPVELDPTVNLPRIGKIDGVPRPIPDALFNRALAGAAGVPRVERMLIVARFAGLRCCELAGAHASDLIDGNIHLVGKGGKSAVVPAHPLVARAYESAATSAGGWLFPSNGSKRICGHLTPGAVSQIGNRHLGVYAPGWTMHKLRHAFGTECYRRSRDVFATQRLMRHASPATTAGYVKLADHTAADLIATLDTRGAA